MKTMSKIGAGILLCAGFVQVTRSITVPIGTVTSSVTVPMIKQNKKMPLEYALVDKDSKKSPYFRPFKSGIEKMNISFSMQNDTTLYIKGWGKPDKTAQRLQLPKVGAIQYDKIIIDAAGVPRYEKSKYDPSMKPMAN